MTWEEGEQSLPGGASIRCRQDAMHCRAAQTGCMREHAATPRTSGLGRGLSTAFEHVGNTFARDASWRARARSIEQTSEAILDKPSPPFVDSAPLNVVICRDGAWLKARRYVADDRCS